MLCKICVEYRDFLKKSGLWFNKNLLSIQLPSVLESIEEMSPQTSLKNNSDKTFDSSLDDKKNSVFSSDSKYVNLDNDTDSLKSKTNKSMIEVNDPNQESKLLLEEVAISKQTNVNISNLDQKSFPGDGQKFLFKTSTLANGDSTQNISLAFRKFMDTETSRCSSFAFLYKLIFFSNFSNRARTFTVQC